MLTVINIQIYLLLKFMHREIQIHEKIILHTAWCNFWFSIVRIMIKWLNSSFPNSLTFGSISNLT